MVRDGIVSSVDITAAATAGATASAAKGAS
jgi:hypothetical protein